MLTTFEWMIIGLITYLFYSVIIIRNTIDKLLTKIEDINYYNVRMTYLNKKEK